jgi:hypothetical protein
MGATTAKMSATEATRQATTSRRNKRTRGQTPSAEGVGRKGFLQFYILAKKKNL